MRELARVLGLAVFALKVLVAITADNFLTEEDLVPFVRAEMDKILEADIVKWDNMFADEAGDNDDQSQRRGKSGFPTMYMNRKKKVRTCQNMKGMLGGANAFNFLSFVAGVVTLVVNVNNNINNNNNSNCYFYDYC